MNSVPAPLVPAVPPFVELQAPAGWHALLFPCGAFPAKRLETETIDAFLEPLMAELEKTRNLQRHVLLQVWKLGPGTGVDVLNRHIGAWRTTLGLGIWPDRDPPRAWTNEDVSDAAAAMFRKEEVPLCSHKLMSLGIGGAEAAQAAQQMRGFGTLIQVLSPASLAAMQTSCREVFLPRIQAPRFRMARFFLPVLDSASIAAARSAAELAEWLGGAELYVRESPEDQGVLVLSQYPLVAGTQDAQATHSAAAKQPGFQEN